MIHYIINESGFGSQSLVIKILVLEDIYFFFLGSHLILIEIIIKVVANLIYLPCNFYVTITLLIKGCG
jgi:hypothetical protein